MAIMKSNRKVSIDLAKPGIAISGNFPVLTLNTWQIVGFTASIGPDRKSLQGAVFGETSFSQFYWTYSEMDFSTLNFLRIGDSTNSFDGQISAIRVMTPGGGVFRTTDLCSSDNSIELGVGSFALACSGSNNLFGGECVSTCPTNSFFISQAAVPICGK